MCIRDRDILRPKDNYEKLTIKKPLDKKTQYKIWKAKQEEQSISPQLSTHDNPLSVVLIIRKKSKTLVKCIEAVLTQSFSKFELVIVTDDQNTFETINELINTKTINEVNLGYKKTSLYI